MLNEASEKALVSELQDASDMGLMMKSRVHLATHPGRQAWALNTLFSFVPARLRVRDPGTRLRLRSRGGDQYAIIGVVSSSNIPIRRNCKVHHTLL